MQCFQKMCHVTTTLFINGLYETDQVGQANTLLERPFLPQSQSDWMESTPEHQSSSVTTYSPLDLGMDFDWVTLHIHEYALTYSTRAAVEDWTGSPLILTIQL